MPKVHYCEERFCRKIIPLKQRYCPEHVKLHIAYSGISKQQKKQMDKRYNTFERDQEANSFYHSKEWRKVRDYVIAKQMNTCQFCGDIVTDKKIVDHLIRREYCNNPLDTSNLNVLCQTCHNFKSNMETSMKAHGKENVLKYASFNWWKKTILKKRNKHTHP